MNFIPITVAQDEDIRDVLIDADRSYRLEPDGYLLATYYSLDGKLMVCPPRGYKLIVFNGSETFGDIRFDEEPKIWDVPEVQFEDDYVADIVIEHDGQIMEVSWSAYYEFTFEDGILTGVLRDYDTFQRLPFNSARVVNIGGDTDVASIIDKARDIDKRVGSKRDLGYDIRIDGDRFLAPLKLSGYDDTVFVDLVQWNDTTRAIDDLIIHGEYWDAGDRPIRPLGVTECFDGYTDKVDMRRRYRHLRRDVMLCD